MKFVNITGGLNIRLKIDKYPKNNFDRNIRKIQAIIKIYGYIDIIYKGKLDSKLKPYSDILEEIMSLSGLDLSEFEKEFEEKLEKIDDKEANKKKDKIEKLVKKFIEKREEGIKAFFESFKLAYDEIFLEQATVMLVTAFEVYLRDTAKSLINKNPKIADRFYDEINKKLDYNRLKESGLDLRGKIGDLVLEKRNLFEIIEIKELYKTILKKKDILINEKHEKQLKKLFELRHLIVHKACLVDDKFKKASNTTIKIGKRYPIKKRYIIESIKMIEVIVARIEKDIN